MKNGSSSMGKADYLGMITELACLFIYILNKIILLLPERDTSGSDNK